ncbi:MAG TPA: chromosomal replication initiator protein DnaA, partial [Gammaproteobacteria bacterium]|nr:chromosomal replication initiator protein DnaA [Gammaproteobacteria bacterium]
MHSNVWHQCLQRLERELSSQQFNTWIRPLQVVEDDGDLKLYAPNRFVLDWINDQYLERITEILDFVTNGAPPKLSAEVGSKPSTPDPQITHNIPSLTTSNSQSIPSFIHPSQLNPAFTFDTYVEGKSNHFARAASVQIAENPGQAYNPLFIYGGVGLGKTHLMHAVGNLIQKAKPNAKVAYLHAERFVADMV